MLSPISRLRVNTGLYGRGSFRKFSRHVRPQVPELISPTAHFEIQKFSRAPKMFTLMLPYVAHLKNNYCDNFLWAFCETPSAHKGAISPTLLRKTGSDGPQKTNTEPALCYPFPSKTCRRDVRKRFGIRSCRAFFTV